MMKRWGLGKSWIKTHWALYPVNLINQSNCSSEDLKHLLSNLTNKGNFSIYFINLHIETCTHAHQSIHPLYSRKCSKTQSNFGTFKSKVQSCKACSWLPSKRLDPESGIFSGIVTKIWLQSSLQWSELNWPSWSCLLVVCPPHLCGGWQGFVEVWSLTSTPSSNILGRIGVQEMEKWGVLQGKTESLRAPTEKSLHSTSIGRDRCCGILLRSEFCNTQQPGSRSSKNQTWGFPEKQRRHTTENDACQAT